MQISFKTNMNGVIEEAVKTESVAVEEWQDPPEEGKTVDDWPYPKKYRKCKIEGALANAVYKKLGITWRDRTLESQFQNGVSEDFHNVYLTEVEVSGGWSDYTQEDGNYLLLECAGRTFQWGQDNDSTEPIWRMFFDWLEK